MNKKIKKKETKDFIRSILAIILVLVALIILFINLTLFKSESKKEDAEEKTKIIKKEEEIEKEEEKKKITPEEKKKIDDEKKRIAKEEIEKVEKEKLSRMIKCGLKKEYEKILITNEKKDIGLNPEDWSIEIKDKKNDYITINNNIINLDKTKFGNGRKNIILIINKLRQSNCEFEVILEINTSSVSRSGIK